MNVTTSLVTSEKEPINWPILIFDFVLDYCLNNSSLINRHIPLNMIARMSGLRNSLLMSQQDSHRVSSHIHVPVDSLKPYTPSVSLCGNLVSIERLLAPYLYHLAIQASQT